MCKFKSRSFVYNAVFVVVVVVAAMASAVLETAAVLGGWPAIDEVPTARSPAPGNEAPAVAGASVDGTRVSVAAPAAH